MDPMCSRQSGARSGHALSMTSFRLQALQALGVVLEGEQRGREGGTVADEPQARCDEKFVATVFPSVIC